MASVLVTALTLVAWASYASAGDSGMGWRDTAGDAPAALTVSEVAPVGGAAVAGLRAGDRIVWWKSWPVADPEAPFRRPLELRAGERAVLTVRRFVPPPAPGVAGSHGPEEAVEVVFGPALVRARPALAAGTAVAVAALLLGAGFALLRPARIGARAAFLCGSYVALAALAAPVAFAALRLRPPGFWLLVGTAVVMVLLPLLPLAPVLPLLPRQLQRALVLALLVFAGVAGVGVVRTARIADDGLRVWPVSRQGLLIVRVVPGSAASAAGLGAGQRVVVGVDGYVTRDVQHLWQRLWSRAPGARGSLQVQGSASGGTGTGLGPVWNGHVQLQSRLATPHVALGLAATSLAGLAALAVSAAAAAVHRPQGSRLLPLGAASAALCAVQVWAASGSVPSQLSTALVWPAIQPDVAEGLGHSVLGLPALVVVIAGLRVLSRPGCSDYPDPATQT